MKEASFASKICEIDRPVRDTCAVSSDAMGSKFVSGTLFMLCVIWLELVALTVSKVNTSAKQIDRIRDIANYYFGLFESLLYV